jgi:uncharacterized protein YndB with AHSA1/START domain
MVMMAGVGLYGAGSALPEEMVTIRGAQYQQPVDKIWPLVTDFAQLKRWNDAIANVTPIPAENIQETLWDVEDAEGRHMVLKVLLKEDHKAYQVKIIRNDLPFTGNWRFEFTTNEKGTWLKMEERSHISNPFLRVFAYYVLGSDYGVKAYLLALARHLGQSVEIKELAA